MLTKAANILEEDIYKEFKILAKEVTNYLGENNEYINLVNDLFTNIKENDKNHILGNNEIYSGFKS